MPNPTTGQPTERLLDKAYEALLSAQIELLRLSSPGGIASSDVCMEVDEALQAIKEAPDHATA